MHHLDSILEECRQTLDDLNIKYAARITATVSPRLKRCWGSCRRNPDGSYTIRLSTMLLGEGVPADSLRDTLYHELLHTVPGAMNHGKTWLQLAQKVNRATGLNIKPTAPASEKGVVRDPVNDPSVKFLCICEGCGAQIVRYRMCDFARRTDKYRCGSCGGAFRVIVNRF